MNYDKYTKGTDIKDAALMFKTSAPLDDRTVVLNKGSLIAIDTWTNLDYVFNGMMTVTLDEGKLYILKFKLNLVLKSKEQIDTLINTNLLDTEINKSWVLASADMTAVNDLIDEKVATLFQFKGVAISVSLDYTTLTIGTATLAGNALLCFRADYDLAHNLFYAWSTDPSDSEAVIYYTDSPSIGTNTTIYEAKSSFISVSYIEYMNEVYMPEGAAVNGVTTWLPLYTDDVSEGSPIYSKIIDGITKYSFDNTFTTTLTDVTSGSYEGRTFSTIVNPGITGNSRLEVASDSNNGHVYQIKEDEYASNGATWVQLGSPKTDWIIL